MLFELILDDGLLLRLYSNYLIQGENESRSITFFGSLEQVRHLFGLVVMMFSSLKTGFIIKFSQKIADYMKKH